MWDVHPRAGAHRASRRCAGTVEDVDHDVNALVDAGDLLDVHLQGLNRVDGVEAVQILRELCTGLQLVSPMF